MTNYHNEDTQFTVGQSVTHVTDEGAMVKGTVQAVQGDLLHISFADGEDGWEKAETCVDQANTDDPLPGPTEECTCVLLPEGQRCVRCQVLAEIEKSEREDGNQ